MSKQDKVLVPASVLRDSLSPEGRAEVDRRVEAERPRMEFFKKLRQSLNLNDLEFAGLLLECGGSANELSIMQIYDSVTQRGGKIEVNITFD